MKKEKRELKYVYPKLKNELNEEDFEKLSASEYDLSGEKEEKNLELLAAYRNTIDILKEYLDLNEEYYSIIAIWIVGTYFHKYFPSYPYLYLNAMRGSGKTRLLKIIKCLSKDGEMLNSLTEAVLFRTKGTLCIDEFEGVVRKGNETLRELLNSAYKKGTKVKRMKKVKTLVGEEQVVESFDVYRPIAIANITGMENVLSDRCVTLILEKSNKAEIINLIEIFEMSDIVLCTKELLEKNSKFSDVSDDDVSLGNVYKLYERWNNYIKYNTTNITNLTNTTNTTNVTESSKSPNLSFLDFNKLKSAGINGRHLELSFPLIYIASLFGEEDKIITSLIKIVEEKKEDDLNENTDISLFDFISQSTQIDKFVTVKQLTQDFRDFLGSNEDWLNTKWMGRALKRLVLIKSSRKRSYGREIMLNIDKAQERIKMFK